MIQLVARPSFLYIYIPHHAPSLAARSMSSINIRKTGLYSLFIYEKIEEKKIPFSPTPISCSTVLSNQVRKRCRPVAPRTNWGDSSRTEGRTVSCSCTPFQSHTHIKQSFVWCEGDADHRLLHSAAMQSQPLVDIEVHHHRLTYHSGLHSLTRFRSAVRNVAQTLHLSGNHHHRQPVEAGASTTSSEPNSPRLQPNRLKKGFSGPRSLLKRFRSVAKTMSAEDEDGSGAGATPPKGAITEPDTVAATSDNWNSTCDQQPQVKS